MKAEILVQLGESSSARQVFEGAALAPGDNATLTALTNDAKRPSRPREPLPREVIEHVAVNICALSLTIGLQCRCWSKLLRCLPMAERGAQCRGCVPQVCGAHNGESVGPSSEEGDVPPQYALSARAGCECIAHAQQRLTGVEQSWREAPNLRCPGTRCANGESQSCCFGAAGDQSVGDSIGS